MDTKNQEKVNKKFESFKEQQYTDADKEKVFRNEKKIKKIASKGKLKQFSEYISYFFYMLKDYFSGAYKEVPVRTITFVILTLLYVLSPIDIIPDCIPITGLIDDAGMVTLCLSSIRDDLDKYIEFLNKKKG